MTKSCILGFDKGLILQGQKHFPQLDLNMDTAAKSRRMKEGFVLRVMH